MLPRHLATPAPIKYEALNGTGYSQLWGYSPAMDMQEVGDVAAADGEVANFLNLCTGDPRCERNAHMRFPLRRAPTHPLSPTTPPPLSTPRR